MDGLETRLFKVVVENGLGETKEGFLEGISRSKVINAVMMALPAPKDKKTAWGVKSCVQAD